MNEKLFSFTTSSLFILSTEPLTRLWTRRSSNISDVFYTITNANFHESLYPKVSISFIMTHVPCPLPPQQVGCPIQGDLRTAKSFDYENFIYDSSLLYLENVWSLQMKTAGYWSLAYRRSSTQHWVSRIGEGIKIFFSNVEEENFTEIKWSSFVPYQLPHQPIYFWSWMRESPFAAKS